MMEKDSLHPSERTVYLDALRLMAAFAVVMLHTTAQNWSVLVPASREWQVINLYSSLTRWAVPVFVMISGAVFLQKERSCRNILRRYVFRFLAAFLFWGFVYGIVYGKGLWGAILISLSGHTHLWYLPMLAGLYLCQPVLRQITRERKLTEYYLSAAAVIVFLIPTAITMGMQFGSQAVSEGLSALQKGFGNLNFGFFSGYVFYFLAGDYLHRYSLSDRQRRLLYLAGILSALATVCLSCVISLRMEKPVGSWFNPFSFNNMLMALAVFVWTKHHEPAGERARQRICAMAKYTFGIYLIHVMVLEQLFMRGILDSLAGDPLLSVPAISAFVVLLSMAATWVCKRIPIVRTYFV